jgi:tRNA nucleotidyltransferase (CCA-adding enzyme)
VGGIVRDAVLGLEAKDFDVEIYGLEKSQVEKALQRVGRINLVGKNFGVIKVLPFTGDVHEFDVSLPRLENKIGRGIKGFVTDFPPTLTLRQAAQRRDFTINAFAFDPFSNEFFDFFDGLNDLNDRILRHIGPAFAEDPERVRRGMQFAARFDMQVAP